MNNSDLAEIRARLRAAAEDRRPPPRGPLGALRGLLGAKPRPPLLGAPMSYASRPVRAVPPSPEGEDEPLLLDQAVEAPRRHAFGQRPEAAPEPPPRQAPPAPAPMVVGDGDMTEAIRRLSSPLLRRVEDAGETPFLPEDLTDVSETEVERIYTEAGLAPALPAPDSPLTRLERRLMEEHMILIRAIAGV
jgi:hypothetical protein